jgi:uncharacterized membrane protein
MQEFVKIYLISLPVFFGIDLVWLTLIARKLYVAQLGNLMRPDVNWLAAILFYLLFIVGLIIFAIMPAIEKHSWLQALIYGALFGFFTYATYDLTNLATLKNWPALISIIDMVWGTVLAGLVSVIVYFILSKIG